MSDDRARVEAARLLRQRLELGETELYLDATTPEAVLDGLRALARSGASGASGASAASAASAASGRPEREPVGTRESAPPMPRARVDGSGPRSDRPVLRDTPGADRPTAPRTSPSDRPAGKGASPSPGAVPVQPEPSSESSVELPVLPDDYEALRDLAMGCTRCGLSRSRTRVVFSDGPADARLMVVGEAPGANEDETGLPFVGAAGKFLDLLLGTVGLSRRESVYIANVLKCRPPGNRNPTDLEIETCSPFLRKQIDLVAPSALLAVGSFSAKLLTGQDKTALGKLRGTVHSYHGVPLVVTYHPAALLRNARWTRLVWEDLQLLRDVLDA